MRGEQFLYRFVRDTGAIVIHEYPHNMHSQFNRHLYGALRAGCLETVFHQIDEGLREQIRIQIDRYCFGGK